jgi:hypothetical protein
MAAASVRVDTPSLPRMFKTWTPAVFSLINSSSAMRLFVWPGSDQDVDLGGHLSFLSLRYRVHSVFAMTPT